MASGSITSRVSRSTSGWLDRGEARVQLDPRSSQRRSKLRHSRPISLSAGKSAVKAVLSPEFAKLKGAPKLTTTEEATAFLHSCIPFTFFLRVARANASPHKILQITPQQLFVPDEYYAWFVDPNPVKGLLMAGAMVAVVLAGVMFPLWPLKMRIGVWYLSMGVLGLIGLFFATAIVRLVVWCVTVVVLKPGIWIFPNLFADVGFVSHYYCTSHSCPPGQNCRLGASSLCSLADPSSAARPRHSPPPLATATRLPLCLTRRSTRSSRCGAGTSRRPRRSSTRRRTRRARRPRSVRSV